MVILAVMAVMAAMVSCDEGKRFEISGKDKEPPAPPTFIKSEPLPGGARVFFKAPDDEDLLSIEASYTNAAGKPLRFAVSYFTDFVDVFGFDREGSHNIELFAVDRAGNRSESVPATVTAHEPPAVTVAKTVNVLPSFASMLVKWENTSSVPLYVWVDFSYVQDGEQKKHSTVFSTIQTETRTIDSLKLFAGEQVWVNASVRDKYDNVAPVRDIAVVLLVDGVIDKSGWRLLDAGAQMGDAVQATGIGLETVIDGKIDIEGENYFITTQSNWNIIIDLGDEYEISRILTHQRWSGFSSGTQYIEDMDERGNLYRGNNVFAYNVYGWNETGQSWTRLSSHTIVPPVVANSKEYTTLGKAGDLFFLYPNEPQFSPPTRYIRYQAIGGRYISEITLYGRKKK